MNEALLQWVHRAIRSDRSALRALIERYQGVTYALAFQLTKSFPHAQRVAQASWPRVAARLPSLAEPERFLDLLAAAVEEAYRAQPPAPTEQVAAAEEPHSILRTEKVQARRKLRQGLAECALPETVVFFLRHVEGLALDEIAQLHGIEHPAALAALKTACVHVAYHAGFAGSQKHPPDPAGLGQGRREAIGFAVELAEGGAAREMQDRIALLLQTDVEARHEDEAVRMVLDLATRTFAAHRLPPDFLKDVLMAIPHAEPARTVAPHSPSASPLASAARQEPSPNPAWPLGIIGALAGMLALLWFAGWISETRWGMRLSYWVAGAAALIFALGLGVIALVLACPIRAQQKARFPPVFLLGYGLLCGVGLALLWLTFFDPAATGGLAVCDWVAPLWAVAALGLLGLRVRLLFQDLEQRTEERIRRIEDRLPSHAHPQPEAPAQLDEKSKA